VERFGQSAKVGLPWARISGFCISGEDEVKSQKLGRVEPSG